MMKTILTLLIVLSLTPGIAQTIELVEDIVPGLSGSTPTELTVANGLLFFVADDGVNGKELWVMNDNEEVTLLDLTPGADATEPAKLIATETHLFFLTTNYDQNDDFVSHTLWSSDGTLNGTQSLGDFPDEELEIGITGMSTTSSLLFFISSYNGMPGRELWRSDGTPAGTFMIDVNEDPTPSIIFDDFNPAVYEDELYFYSAALNAILRSDGTQAGTTIVVNNANIDPTAQHVILPHQGNLYFITGSAGLRKYAIDGSSDDVLISGGETGVTVRKILQVVNDQLYFFGYTSDHGTELWVQHLSGAAKSPTQMLRDFHLGNAGSITTYGHIAYKDKLYFGSHNHGTANGMAVFSLGSELWNTNGTPTGTKLFKDINQGVESGLYYIMEPQLYANHLFFAADDGTHGSELWVTDGNPNLVITIGSDVRGGTYMVQDLRVGVGFSNPTNLTVYKSILYFAAYDGVHGRELFHYQIPKVYSGKKIASVSPINAFPNPTQGRFTLNWDEAIAEPGILTITDYYGNVVQKDVVNFPLSRQIDLGRRYPGMYMIKIVVGDQQFTQKVMVNR
ncbi:MAG: T9SS type A sorting domain-containing protein [Cyclobacteriaceae bacterium]